MGFTGVRVEWTWVARCGVVGRVMQWGSGIGVGVCWEKRRARMWDLVQGIRKMGDGWTGGSMGSTVGVVGEFCGKEGRSGLGGEYAAWAWEEGRYGLGGEYAAWTWEEGRCGWKVRKNSVERMEEWQLGVRLEKGRLG
ncbi:hypothetical protein KI387_030885, partial [Taxus chinensis]